MERIINSYAGFGCINSDLSTTVYGGGIWAGVIRVIKKHLDQFFLGIIEGWTGQDIVSSMSNS